MENKTYFISNQTTDLNTNIYRYMDILELMSILTGTFSVRQKGSWSDKRESGNFFDGMYLSVVNEPVDKEKMKAQRNLYESMKESKDMFTSCWTLNNIESMLMWCAYTTKSHGVLIETTVGKFIESLNLPSYSVMRGAVQYKNSLQGMELYEALFTKEEYYKDEREFRFYFEPNSKGKFQINPQIMISKVILNPFLDTANSKKVKNFLLHSYQFLDKKIYNSKITLNN